MNKKTIWWVLVAYCAVSFFGAFKDASAGGVNLAAISGVAIALLLFTRRYQPEMRGLVVKGLLCACALAAVASVIFAIVASEGGILGTILVNISGGLCAGALVLIVNSSKCDPFETCETKTFIIALLVCLLVLPSIMLLLSGIVSFILAIVLIIAFSAGLFSNLGGFMEANRSKGGVTFKDDWGREHVTGVDRDRANEKIRSDKE